jgi:hypothetical protein
MGRLLSMVWIRQKNLRLLFTSTVIFLRVQATETAETETVVAVVVADVEGVVDAEVAAEE